MSFQLSYWVRLEFNCIFNCSPKTLNVFIVSSMKLITPIFSTFSWYPAILLEAISLFSECCVVMRQMRLDYRCLIWSFNDYSSICFIDEFDHDGAFPLILLMFSDLSFCMVSLLLRWILVSPDFFLITVLLLLRFNMSE